MSCTTKTNRLAQVVEILARRCPTTPNVADLASELATIERSLQTIGERQCSEEMSEETTRRLERREERLEARAREIAAELGMEFYHQSDPRGCQVYLIPPGAIPAGESVDSWYSSRGIPVYRG